MSDIENELENDSVDEEIFEELNSIPDPDAEGLIPVILAERYPDGE